MHINGIIFFFIIHPPTLIILAFVSWFPFLFLASDFPQFLMLPSIHVFLVCPFIFLYFPLYILTPHTLHLKSVDDCALSFSNPWSVEVIPNLTSTQAHPASAFLNNTSAKTSRLNCGFVTSSARDAAHNYIAPRANQEDDRKMLKKNVKGPPRSRSSRTG